MKIRKEKEFISMFDEHTGKYVRTGILKHGRETGEEPFMSSFPELLDIGIMGHCIHGKAGLCLKAGVQCYQDGLHAQQKNMRLEDFKDIAGQCREQTYQFALGGCGDPDQHENFADILEVCRQNQIVPNFTTSGFGMTEETALLCKEYCGAAAVSWYRSDYTIHAIDMLLEAGVKTNIHYVLSRDSISEALEHLKNGGFPKGVNAVVFLLHKPVGLGESDRVVTADNRDFQEFIEYIGKGRLQYKIGFDSCTVPALINQPGNIDMDSLDTCEAGRWSAYISADMKMMPCSFDSQEKKWAVDLRKYSIKEAWESGAFDTFRNHLRNACSDCDKRSLCMGGCPVRPEIVLCTKRQGQTCENAAEQLMENRASQDIEG